MFVNRLFKIFTSCTNIFNFTLEKSIKILYNIIKINANGGESNDRQHIDIF